MAMQGVGVNVWANTAQFVEGMNKASASLRGLEGLAKTAGAAIASHISYSAIKALAEMGAKALQTETAFANATKNMSIDADKWISALKAVTKGTVDESDLMQKAMKGITQGISQENITKLAGVAMTVAIRKGMDVKEAYEGIIDAAETMRTRTLISLGLISKAQAEVAEEAKKAGVEVDMLRVILENTSNQQALIGSLDETALAFQRAKAAAQDFWESLGKEVAKAAGEMYEIVTIIKNLFSAEGRAANQKKADDVLSGRAMNETYFPSPGATTLKSPYLDSLKGAQGRKQGLDDAAKQAEIIQKVIEGLKFETAQLTRTNEEQKIYNALKQAGVTINSKDGQVIANLAAQYVKLEESIKSMAELSEFIARAEEQANADSLADFISKSDEKKRVIAEFTDKRLQAITSELGYSIAKLNEEYAVYDKHIQDKAKLNEWYLAKVFELAEEETERLNQIITDRWETEHEVMNAMRDAWGLTYQEIQDGAVNTWTELGDTLVSVSEQMSQTLSQVMVGFIDGTVNARQAVESLAKSILQNVIQALIKVGVQQVLLATIGSTIQMTSTAATVASMQAVFASASAAAAALSMATFGASATAGMSAYMTSMAASMAFSQGMAGGLFGQTQGMAQGGVINEHIIGRGASGQMYEFGEQGPERVTPMRGRKSASTINININGAVLNNYDELARVLVPAIRKAEYDGV